MTELYLTYDERSYGGEAIDPEDRWTSYTDSHVEFNPKQLYLDREVAGIWVETIDVPFEVERGDIVHLLVVRYGTGDTFSHTDGRWAIMGASKDPKVIADLAKRCDGDKYDGEEEGVVGWYKGYPPWRGYFESYQGSEVSTFVVL
jgi:hypothetical protein